MTQRFCEVALPNSEVSWVIHTIHDGNQYALTDIEQKERAGGQTFTSETTSFVLQWRVIGNIAEIMLEGLSRAVTSCNIRINCSDANLLGDVSFSYENSEILVMLSSSFAVHCIVLDASNLQLGLKIKSTESHPVNTTGSLVHCSAISTEDYGVVFSLVNEDGCVTAITSQNGVYEEIELKQASLMGAIWNRVRRSIVSGPDHSGDIVSTVVSNEHPSIYCLTKNLQLQQWSIGTWECVTSFNLTSYVTASHKIEGVAIKLFTDNSEMILGVHLTDAKQSKILLLSMSCESGLVEECLMVVDCDQNELISFNYINGLLFTLWKNSQGGYDLSHLSWNSPEPSLMRAHLTASCPPPLEIAPYEDPREAFTDHIFDKRSFSSAALLRAISMTDQTVNTSQTKKTTDELKQMTWNAISQDVRRSVDSEEVTNEEYRELQITAWKKFYCNLIQYQEAFLEPMGIVGGAESLPISLIRKTSVSYIRPCEPLEQQILFPSDPLDDSAAINQDVVAIMQALAVLRNHVEGFEDHIFQALLQGEPVSDVVCGIVQQITKRSDHAQLKNRFTSYIQNIHLLRDGISVFQHFLNVVNQFPQQVATISADDDSNPFSAMNDVGCSLVSTAAHDIVKSRYNLCCAVLLFLDYLSLLSEETSKSEELQSGIEELSSTFHALLRAYAVTLWISELNTKSPSEIEQTTGLIDILKITNGESVQQMIDTVSPATSVLDGFLTSLGGVRVKALMNPGTDQCRYYEHLNSLLLATIQALWPETADVLFPEYLLASNETTALQTYCQLLDGYCKASVCSRTFLLGQTYLMEREPVKAYNCFISSLYGMFEEGTLQNPDSDDEVNEQQLRAQQLDFCFKVMNMFEELSYSEQVIQMAHQTLRFSDTQQATLWTKIFKHNLELEHYDEAFKSIITNVDQDRKMDCLHQFVSTLCDKGELKTLVSYPYKDMGTQQDLRNDVISILLNKARSVDLTMKNYYDILYSFHVVNNDLLSAANAMYECCDRLSCELTGLPALQKRAKCYLACIHALHCVPAQSAWIAPGLLTESKYQSGRKSPKRTSAGRSKTKSITQVKILTLADIEREYLLVNMALRLAGNGCKQITGSASMDANEIVGLLCNTGMYDEAIEVSNMYKLSLNPVFESLTFRCMRMSKDSQNDAMNIESEEINRWLTYNRLPMETSYASSSDQAWKILRCYLAEHEDSSTRYHKIIANKLLANGASLPEWLIASYKCTNVAELLRVYLQYDLLENAVDLAVDLMYALTSASYERFGLESSLSATMLPSSVCVPYTSIDIMLNVLQENQHDPYYAKMYQRLKEAVGQYTHDLEEKSKDVEKRLRTAGFKNSFAGGTSSMNWT